MASSRDDFIIAIRSAFLKKSTQQKFSLLTLIFISIFVIILSSLDFRIIRYLKVGINELVYRSSFIVSIPENFAKNTFIEIRDYTTYFNEYKKTRDELSDLKSKNIYSEITQYENTELKELINTVKPKFFVPVHGEIKMQMAHSKIAESENINQENIFILENGEVLLLKDKKLEINGKVPAENILVDGKNLIYEDDVIIKERNQIYKNGIILVTILSDSKYEINKIVDLKSYGVIIDDSYENIKFIKDSLEKNINSSIKKQPKNKKIENFIKEYSSNFLKQKLDIKSKIIVSLVNHG